MAPVARYPILWKKYTGTGKDDYNNEIETWAPAVRVLIYGINFPKSSEPIREGGHNRLIVDRVLLTPPSFACGEKDRIELLNEPGHDYEVVGVQGKSDRNPFRWNPGGNVNVRRVDG